MKTFVSILFLIHLNVGFSQNLVQNPSFEDYLSCPTGLGQVYLAFPWTSPTNNDADLYNSCSSIVGVPYNTGTNSYQMAKTGVGYTGFWGYNGFNNNYREYLRDSLINPMQAGNCYYIEFFVNLMTPLKIAINNIGLYVSNNPVNSTSTGYILDLQPQILKQNNPIILDTMNWVIISGIYYAMGGEQYITIGNFRDDASTNTLITNYGTPYGAYYFIDDVSVIEVTNLPGSMPAFAGNDVTISQLGDSAFIGQEISNLNCNWSILGGSQIATNTSGLYVQPTSTTTYVVEQTLCGTITYDTVTVFVTVGIEELDHHTIFEIYPNPTTGKVFVSSQGIEDGNLNVMVRDITGKEVFNSIVSMQNGETDFELKVESGTYIISIINTITNEKVIRKIAIQK